MKSDTASLVAEVRCRWITSGRHPRPGVPESDIHKFEQRYRVQIPDDLADYFRVIDGMNDEESDEHFIRFWPLAEVRPATFELPEANHSVYEGYFVFADYSLWAHAYAVRLSGKGNDVAIVGGDRPIQVAPSFVIFLQTYLREPSALFP